MFTTVPADIHDSRQSNCQVSPKVSALPPPPARCLPAAAFPLPARCRIPDGSELVGKQLLDLARAADEQHELESNKELHAGHAPCFPNQHASPTSMPPQPGASWANHPPRHPTPTHGMTVCHPPTLLILKKAYNTGKCVIRLVPCVTLPHS